MKTLRQKTGAVWPCVPLDQIANINPRLSLTVGPNELVSFVPMAAVSAETASIVEHQIRPYSEVSKGYTTFNKDDVLVAKITPCFENGKIAQANITERLGFGSSEFHVIRPLPNKLDARYALHFLRLDQVRVAGARRMTGSAGQRRVPENFIAKLEIPLPPLPEQLRIADILDRADALRTLRRQALAELDGLTQSIFLDMFGDPATNPKGWPILKIADLLTSASYGTSEKAGQEGEYPILRMNNITRTGEIDCTDLKYITLEKNKERFLVERGDVLFNRTNSPDLVGKTAIYRRAEVMAFAGYLIRLRVNEKADPEYLAAYLNMPYAKKILRGRCKTIIGMANINATEIQSMAIPLPDLKLQKEYASATGAIVNLKTTHVTYLNELSYLFASLQHRAFRGEL